MADIHAKFMISGVPELPTLEAWVYRCGEEELEIQLHSRERLAFTTPLAQVKLSRTGLGWLAHGLEVQPSARGLGLGRGLWQATLALWRRSLQAPLYLWCDLGNATALRLYRHPVHGLIEHGQDNYETWDQARGWHTSRRAWFSSEPDPRLGEPGQPMSPEQARALARLHGEPEQSNEQDTEQAAPGG